MGKRYDFDQSLNRENTHSVKFDFRSKYFGTTDVLPMWVADMDFRTPDFVIKAIRQRARHEVLGYSIRSESFYTSIIDWLYRRHGWEVNKEWITFSPGIVPALNLCVLAYTRPGDRIIIQPPVYHPFHTAVSSHNRELVLNRLIADGNRYVMDLGDLRKKIDKRTRMLILCSPHNPVARAWTAEELEELALIALKNNLIIVSDEIHSDLVFPPHRHIPLASLSPEISRVVVTCMSPSKTFNMAGLSTSYLITEEAELRKGFSRWIDDLHLWLGNVFGNVALEAAYREGDNWLEQLMRYLQGNFDLVNRFLKERIPTVHLFPPEATYLGWLDFRDSGIPPDKLREFLVSRAKVGFNDGESFGPEGKGFQRMNVACPRPMVQKALEMIEEAFKTWL